MIDQRTIDDEQWVERYLADRLSEDDCVQFEAYVAEHPDVVAQLESVARLKGGLVGLQHAGELQSLIASAPVQSSRSTLRWRIPVAIAATVLVAVAALILHSEDPVGPILSATRGAFSDAAGHALPVIDSYEILRARGDTYDGVIQLPALPGLLELRMAPEFDAQRYRVRLTADTGNRSPVEVRGIQVDSDSSLILYLNASAILPGQYHLEIYSDTDDASAASSLFRLNIVHLPE